MSVDEAIVTTDHGLRQAPARPGPRPGDPTQRGEVVGRYLILDQVGEGAMGVVYRAYDPELDRRVALKLIRYQADPTARQRLAGEAKALAKLSHANVVAVFDVGSNDDAVFIAMELVEGESFAQRLARGPMRWSDAVRYFLEAGRGLAAAHRAHLCHRDFKPSNVMLATNGAVKVADFGLARQDDQRDPPLAADSQSRQDPDLRLTRSGSAAGTPAYMAPEVHRGETADAFSDQYSFFASVFEAVTGGRPFPGPQAQLEEQKQSGSPELPRSLPRWLRHAIGRGLNADPALRFSSMDAALSALERGLGRSRRTWIAAGVVGTGGVLAAALASSPADSRCTDGGDQIAEVWNTDASRRVAEAIESTALPYAGQTAQRVEAELATYAEAWAEAADEACAATHLRKTQSQTMLDRRSLCLEHHRHDLRALVGVLSEADAAVAQRAVSAVSGLPPIDDCSTPAALLTAVAPPADAAEAAAVEVLRQKLAEVRALELAGKYERGLTLAVEGAATADAIGYAPVIAEAYLRHGRILERQGEIEEALERLREAHWTADGQQHDIIAAQAATLVVFVMGSHKHETAAALEWGRHARAAVERLGMGGREEAELLNALGATRSAEGKSGAALDFFFDALKLKRELYPPDHHQIALQLGNIGIALEDLGRYDEARDHYTEALEINQRVLGDRHPQVALTQFNLAGVCALLGEVDEALAWHKRSIAIKRETLPADHPSLGYSLNGLGTALRDVGRFTDARAVHEEAIEVLSAALGEDHPTVANAHNNLGVILRALGEPDAAKAEHLRAFDDWSSRLGEDHPNLAVALLNLGTVAADAGLHEEALEHFEAAQTLTVAALGAEHPRNASIEVSLATALIPLGRLGEARARLDTAAARVEEQFGSDHPRSAELAEHRSTLELAANDPAAAQENLERAHAIRCRPDAPHLECARTELALAEVLFDRGQTNRAIPLARQADRAFQKTQLPEESRNAARRWLENHR